MTYHPSATAALRSFAATEPLDLVVNGHCMRPSMPHGSRVSVRQRRIYLPGDVVAFRRADGRLLVHRLLGLTLGRRGAWLITQGDHLSREDDPVTLDQVIGRVVACDGSATPVSPQQRLRSLARYLRATLRRSYRAWASAPSS
jgi:hypothetical protein